MAEEEGDQGGEGLGFDFGMISYTYPTQWPATVEHTAELLTATEIQ